jgi:hypothetical protein
MRATDLRRAGALMLALAAAPDARAQDTAGYVASVNGAWYTSAHPTQRVTAGRVVAQGEEVWAAPRSSAGAYLNVVLRDGTRLALNCTVPGDCDRRHTLRVREGLLQGAARMVDAVLGLVRRRPDSFVSLIARADGPQPADVVVLGDSAQIDVSAALAGMTAGQYRVALVGGQGSSTHAQAMRAELPFPVTQLAGPAKAWEPGQPFAVRGVPPGLYLLMVQPGEDSPVESWVLVAPPQEHARIAAEFARAREMVSTWTGVDAAHDARVFLRAYLASLAGLVPAEERR